MPKSFNSHRLRKGRCSEPNRIYHITLVCWQRQSRFLSWPAGRYAIAGMRAVEGEAHTLCFVVMPDHVHWLMQLGEARRLSQVVQKMKATVTRHWRRGTHNTLPLWQRGFYDQALRDEDDVLLVARYIVANPLRAGLVTSVSSYPLWDAVWV